MTDFSHPRLGDIRYNGEERVWRAQVSVAGRDIRFSLGGDSTPDGRLMAHAEDIVDDFDSFRRMIGAFLQSEAESSPTAAEEIRRLEVDEICLFWPRKPNSGMIYFTSPAEDRIWRCDYVDRTPRNLGFDS